jgi:hypothetical protein
MYQGKMQRTTVRKRHIQSTWLTWIQNMRINIRICFLLITHIVNQLIRSESKRLSHRLMFMGFQGMNIYNLRKAKVNRVAFCKSRLKSWMKSEPEGQQVGSPHKYRHTNWALQDLIQLKIFRTNIHRGLSPRRSQSPLSNFKKHIKDLWPNQIHQRAGIQIWIRKKKI